MINNFLRICASAAAAIVLSLSSTSTLFAADERSHATLNPNRGPHGGLTFDGTVETISPVTHTINVMRHAVTKPFVVDSQTRLVGPKGQELKLQDFRKGDTVHVLYVASNGVWEAREILK